MFRSDIYSLLTSALDFWEDLSKTSSQDRSESSEKLKFLRDFKSATNNKPQQKYTVFFLTNETG